MAKKDDNYPAEFKELADDTRKKAKETYDKLMKEGRERRDAIVGALKETKEWAKERGKQLKGK